MTFKLKPTCLVLAGLATVGCSGSDSDPGLGINADSELPIAAALFDFVDDASLSAEPAASDQIGAGQVSEESGFDLVIDSAQATGVMETDSVDSLKIALSVTNQGSGGIEKNQLSLGLEFSRDGSFTTVYRATIYDLQPAEPTQGDHSLSLTGRTSLTGVPTGSYAVRAVVNPDWQYHFDIVPSESDHSAPFRYLTESDYSNNTSDVFTVDVSSPVVCGDDTFEPNNTFETATALPVGGQVSASLCDDDLDLYAVALDADAATSISFNYPQLAGGEQRSMRYIVLSPDFRRVGAVDVARSDHPIRVTSTQSGNYYLAFFGPRADYTIGRDSGPGLADDFTSQSVFGAETSDGPYSFQFGQVTLSKLALTADALQGRIVSCGRQTAQYDNGVPTGYATPQHFAEVHDFRFLTDGSYLIDGERKDGWSIVDGDISHPDWYQNPNSGWAENIGNGRWRYWDRQGLAFVECEAV